MKLRSVLRLILLSFPPPPTFSDLIKKLFFLSDLLFWSIFQFVLHPINTALLFVLHPFPLHFFFILRSCSRPACFTSSLTAPMLDPSIRRARFSSPLASRLLPGNRFRRKPDDTLSVLGANFVLSGTMQACKQCNDALLMTGLLR